MEAIHVTKTLHLGNTLATFAQSSVIFCFVSKIYFHVKSVALAHNLSPSRYLFSLFDGVFHVTIFHISLNSNISQSCGMGQSGEDLYHVGMGCVVVGMKNYLNKSGKTIFNMS
jgi:hypothetical protein